MFSVAKSTLIGAACAVSGVLGAPDQSSLAISMPCAADGQGLPESASAFWADRAQIYQEAPLLSPCTVDHITELFLELAPQLEGQYKARFHTLVAHPEFLEVDLDYQQNVLANLKKYNPTYPNFSELESRIAGTSTLSQLAHNLGEGFLLGYPQELVVHHLGRPELFFRSFCPQGPIDQGPIDADCKKEALLDFYAIDVNLKYELVQYFTTLIDLVEREENLTKIKQQYPRTVELFLTLFKVEKLEDISLEHLQRKHQQLDGLNLYESLEDFLIAKQTFDASQGNYNLMFKTAKNFASILNERIRRRPDIKDSIVSSLHESRVAIESREAKEEKVKLKILEKMAYVESVVHLTLRIIIFATIAFAWWRIQNQNP